MATRADVLILNGSRAEGEALAARIQGLGFRPALAKSPDEARTLVDDARLRIEAAILPASLPVADLGGAIRTLRALAGSRRLEFVAAGPRPGPAGLDELRAAGIRLVLWEPFPDAALRFQLNRALEASQRRKRRGERRLPVARRVRILSGSFVRAASLYTLSPSGAFIETSRPALRNAPVDLELLLPDGDLRIAARVVYTNVPGNLQRENLPIGMGVRFERMEAGGMQAIEACLRDAAERLELEPAPPPAGRDGSWLGRLVRRVRGPR